MNQIQITKRRLKKSHARSAIVTGLLLLAGHSLLAQKGFDAGIRLGVQTSSFINNTDIAAGPQLDYKNPTNVCFGAGAGYSINRRMGVGIDVIYSKQGQHYKGLVTEIPATSDGVLASNFEGLAALNNIPFSGSYTAAVDITCVKIPIMFRFNGKNTKRVFLSTFIGPQVNLLTSAKMKVNDADASPASVGLTSKQVYKTMTIDGVLGVGAGINLTKNLVLGVHFRLDYGFSDIEDKDKKVPASSSTFFDPQRASTHNATGGGLISLNYKFIKKATTPVKGKDADKKKVAPKKK